MRAPEVEQGPGDIIYVCETVLMQRHATSY